MIGLHSMA